jgi:hypothetical protein
MLKVIQSVDHLYTTLKMMAMRPHHHHSRTCSCTEKSVDRRSHLFIEFGLTVRVACCIEGIFEPTVVTLQSCSLCVRIAQRETLLSVAAAGCCPVKEATEKLTCVITSDAFAVSMSQAAT